MKILITKADGFIGFHLIEMLVQQGFNIRGLVLHNSFNT